MNPIIDAIIENLQYIKIDFNPTLKSFRKDTKQTSDLKEVSVKDFIGSFFPSNYIIKKGGIYDTNGVSNEIDCVILAPNHPGLCTPKRELILAEGVYAAVEVKPDISTLTKKSEFYRGLMQIKSVKNLGREINVLSSIKKSFKSDNYKKIPCSIFSNKSGDLEKVVKYMAKLVEKGDLKSNELPDIVFSLEKGIIFHTTCFEDSIFKVILEEKVKIDYNDIFIVMDKFNNDEESLCMFLLILLSFTTPEPLFSDFIIKKYLKATKLPFEYATYIVNND